MLSILLIDDDPDDLRRLTEALSEASFPVSVHAAINPVVGYRFLTKQGEFRDAPTPDLIILDLRIQVIGSLIMLREMRQSPAMSHLPVVILSSSRRDQDRNECLQLGAVDYLIKPTVWKDGQRLANRLVRFMRCSVGQMR